jgi:hypothetical protein
MVVAEFLVGSFLALLGIYLTHSFRRQQNLRIAERRCAAYRPLWQVTKITRQSRHNKADRSGLLTRGEGRKLRKDMLDWYYTDGNGMFLTRTTNELYTQVRMRLSEYIVGDDDDVAAERCMRDFSLLRQQMRLDIKTLSGRPSYWKDLDDGDRELLRDAGIRDPDTWGLPWYSGLRRRLHLATRTSPRAAVGAPVEGGARAARTP